MNASDVVAYAWQAEIVCPACVRRVAASVSESHGLAADYVPLARLLARWASIAGIPEEYDTADFPAPMFPNDVAHDDTCGHCLERIME